MFSKGNSQWLRRANDAKSHVVELQRGYMLDYGSQMHYSDDSDAQGIGIADEPLSRPN